jgi:hypothetical protein
MSGERPPAPAQPAQGPPESASAEAAVDAVQALGQQARQTAQSALETGKALGHVLAADLALAGSASLHALVFGGIALVLGGSSWLLLMAWLVAVLQAAGLSWWLALLLPALLSLAGCALAAWLTVIHLQQANLAATRRQLARFVTLHPLAPPASKGDA